MKLYNILGASLLALFLSLPAPASACTGITLRTAQGHSVLARTVEWGGNENKSSYVIVPRGHVQQSYLMGMKQEGMVFKAKYGYVGLSVEMPEFIIEGLNEKGLSAGLFYFPHYGDYGEITQKEKKRTVSDMQFCSWILGSFENVNEVKDHLSKIRISSVDPRSSTVHWRVADPSGRQIVIEVIQGEIKVYDNPLGVLTNSPDFPWQMTNLNNYINLAAGTTASHDFGGIRLHSFGTGSAHLGLPGDVTPPSRFVRAAFYQTTAPTPDNARKGVLTAFHILNNFDIPLGVEFADKKIPEDMPSATQWTSASDLSGLKLYFRTMHNSHIRMIDLGKIDFDTVSFSAQPLDPVKEEPIIALN